MPKSASYMREYRARLKTASMNENLAAALSAAGFKYTRTSDSHVRVQLNDNKSMMVLITKGKFFAVGHEFSSVNELLDFLKSQSGR